MVFLGKLGFHRVDFRGVSSLANEPLLEIVLELLRATSLGVQFLLQIVNRLILLGQLKSHLCHRRLAAAHALRKLAYLRGARLEIVLLNERLFNRLGFYLLPLYREAKLFRWLKTESEFESVYIDMLILETLDLGEKPLVLALQLVAARRQLGHRLYRFLERSRGQPHRLLITTGCFLTVASQLAQLAAQTIQS